MCKRIQTLDYTEMTKGLISAYVSNNPVSVRDLPALIATTYTALTGMRQSRPASAGPAVKKSTPAQVRQSITAEALVSFIDGWSGRLGVEGIRLLV